jgi:hypothetical protein
MAIISRRKAIRAETVIIKRKKFLNNQTFSFEKSVILAHL